MIAAKKMSQKSTFTRKVVYLLLVAIAIIFRVKAANYYFSSSAGDDTRTPIQAQNMLTPWKTLTKLNSFISSLQPGDSVLFKRGDVFYGSIVITKSGTLSAAISFSSYGSGAKPVINGLTTVSGWVNKGLNIWEADCPSCGATVTKLIINDSSFAMGRYPNTTDPNKGYLTFEANGPLQITDNELSGTPNWTGGETVIRSSRWTLDRCPITSHTGTTINYPLRAGSATLGTAYALTNGFGYFIQNHPLTLDKYGEWYYNPGTKKILLYTNTSNPSALTIEASTQSNLVSCSNQNYIRFDNLAFRGSNSNSINISNSNFFSIANCDVRFAGYNAINASGLSHFDFKNNTVRNTNNSALEIASSNYSTIKNNTLINTGLDPGQGGSGVGKYTGIGITGNNNNLEYNNIYNTGYIPLNFQGDTVLVKNNFINNYTLVIDDGGGIYTWNGCPSSISGIYGTIHRNRKIIGNIVLNGIAAPQGTDNLNYSPAEGIYMDDNTNNVEIVGNTVANCARSGIFLHNSHEIMIAKNTSFNSSLSQLNLEANGTCTTDTIINNKINANMLFSKNNSQLVSKLFADSTNDINIFGSFDSNYYCRPLNEEFIIQCQNAISNNNYNLSQWQTAYSKDVNSQKTPIQIPQYTVNNLIGNNKYVNGNFNTTINGLYCWSPESNCSTVWDNTGTLDGGSLKFSFSSVSGKANRSLLIIGVGNIDASKKYILKFSLKGTKNNQSIGTNLRQSLSPYSNLTAFQNCILTKTRTENQFLFSPTATESNASMQFEIDEADSTLWIDNIELYEANVTLTNPDDYIRFEYNATQLPKTITLSDSYIDVKNNPYSGSLTLQPFTSIILLKKFPPTSINYLQRSNYDFLVYPNPVSEFIMIELANPAQEDCRIELINMLGQKILVENLQTGTFSRQINTASVPTGVYTLLLSNNNNVVIKKVMVTR